MGKDRCSRLRRPHTKIPHLFQEKPRPPEQIAGLHGVKITVNAPPVRIGLQRNLALLDKNKSNSPFSPSLKMFSPAANSVFDHPISQQLDVLFATPQQGKEYAAPVFFQTTSIHFIHTSPRLLPRPAIVIAPGFPWQDPTRSPSFFGLLPSATAETLKHGSFYRNTLEAEPEK